jgi:hypothetical protein
VQPNTLLFLTEFHPVKRAINNFFGYHKLKIPKTMGRFVKLRGYFRSLCQFSKLTYGYET